MFGALAQCTEHPSPVFESRSALHSGHLSADGFFSTRLLLSEFHVCFRQNWVKRLFATMNHPSKICSVCGRTINWRKKWEKDWDSIRKCGKRCRSRRLGDQDIAYETAIISSLRDTTTRRNGILLLSDATSSVSADEKVTEKVATGLHERAKEAARRLAAREMILILDRKNVPTDPSHAKGDMRLAKGPAFDRV